MSGADVWLMVRIVLAGLVGGLLGRLLHACIDRFPRSDALSDQLKSLLRPWPVCLKCCAKPSLVECLPFVRRLTGRRCHACGRPLSRSVAVIEVITAVLFGLLYWRSIPSSGAFSSCGLTSSEGPAGPESIASLMPDVVWMHARLLLHAAMVASLIVATEIDRRLRIIPDGSTVPVMILAVIVSGLSGQLYLVPIWFQDASLARTVQPLLPEILHPLIFYWDASEFVQSSPHLHGLLVSVVGLLVGAGAVWVIRQIGFLTLRQEAMGFGDVVLMGMVGSVIGWQPVLAVIFIGAPVLAVAFALFNWLVHGDNEIPYGPFLSAATILLLLAWPDAWWRVKHFFDLGPILMVLGVLGVVCLSGLLIAVSFIKKAMGLGDEDEQMEGEWTSADHLSYYGNERPDEQTGLWQTRQWLGSRAGRGLQHYRTWKGDR